MPLKLCIEITDAGTVTDINTDEMIEEWILVTDTQDVETIKKDHLGGIHNREDFEEFDTFWISKKEVEQGDIGNILYACSGFPYLWKKLSKIMVCLKEV